MAQTSARAQAELTKQKVRARGESPNLLFVVYHHLPKKAMIYWLAGLLFLSFVIRQIVKWKKKK
ncbi:TPA: hypothetical protein ACGO80_000457 [Streptococcus suis]